MEGSMFMNKYLNNKEITENFNFKTNKYPPDIEELAKLEKDMIIENIKHPKVNNSF